MHTAENPDLSYDNGKLNSVLTETAQGISDPANDFETQHTENNLEQNLFYQFLIGSRKGDVEPSQLHMNLLQALNDNVLLASLYTSPYIGSSPALSGGSNASLFKVGPATPMIIVGNYENLLLSAEAHYRLGNTATLRQSCRRSIPTTARPAPCRSSEARTDCSSRFSTRSSLADS
jgi:hypothetical protein